MAFGGGAGMSMGTGGSTAGSAGKAGSAGMSSTGGTGTGGTGSAGRSGTGGAGGTGGSSAGAGGSAGTGSSCSPPAVPTSCMDADDFCAGYSYMTGDQVLAKCTVGTAGCISGRTMLFECKSACTSQTPGTGVDNSKWSIVNQCN
jgi:hypothetical protein